MIENRSLGRAYPNRGIACLAPVACDSFLSGGHDKMVHHWKIARGSDRKKGRAGWAASSVRIPMDHTQSVQALAYCGWNETVYSAAGDRIASTKLAALTHAESERVSGKITQVHVHPQDPRLIALEVGQQLMLAPQGSSSKLFTRSSVHVLRLSETLKTAWALTKFVATRSTIWTTRCSSSIRARAVLHANHGLSLVIALQLLSLLQRTAGRSQTRIQARAQTPHGPEAAPPPNTGPVTHAGRR